MGSRFREGLDAAVSNLKEANRLRRSGTSTQISKIGGRRERRGAAHELQDGRVFATPPKPERSSPIAEKYVLDKPAITTKKNVVPRPIRGMAAGFGSNSIAGEAMEYSFSDCSPALSLRFLPPPRER
jgi:hypothetical protein